MEGMAIARNKDFEKATRQSAWLGIVSVVLPTGAYLLTKGGLTYDLLTLAGAATYAATITGVILASKALVTTTRIAAAEMFNIYLPDPTMLYSLDPIGTPLSWSTYTYEAKRSLYKTINEKEYDSLTSHFFKDSHRTMKYLYHKAHNKTLMIANNTFDRKYRNHTKKKGANNTTN